MLLGVAVLTSAARAQEPRMVPVTVDGERPGPARIRRRSLGRSISGGGRSRVV